jgi:Flp pilus assembly protein protease CpaA
MLYLILILVTATDIRYRIIPKRLNFLALASIPLSIEFEKILWAYALFLIHCIFFRLSGGRIGYGDVRLAPVAAILSDAANPFLIHAFAWLLAGMFLLYKRKMNITLPFAPFFSLSALFLPHL